MPWSRPACQKQHYAPRLIRKRRQPHDILSQNMRNVTNITAIMVSLVSISIQTPWFCNQSRRAHCSHAGWHTCTKPQMQIKNTPCVSACSKAMKDRESVSVVSTKRLRYLFHWHGQKATLGDELNFGEHWANQSFGCGLLFKALRDYFKEIQGVLSSRTPSQTT